MGHVEWNPGDAVNGTKREVQGRQFADRVHWVKLQSVCGHVTVVEKLASNHALSARNHKHRFGFFSEHGLAQVDNYRCDGLSILARKRDAADARY